MADSQPKFVHSAYGNGEKSQSATTRDHWIPQAELAQTVAHPFYTRLNQVLEERGFDEFVEGRCAAFYAERMGDRRWHQDAISAC